MPDGEAWLRWVAATRRGRARPSGVAIIGCSSDLDGPVDEASVSVPLAYKRALFCGERPSKGGARTRDGLVRLHSLGAPGMAVS